MDFFPNGIDLFDVVFNDLIGSVDRKFRLMREIGLIYTFHLTVFELESGEFEVNTILKVDDVNEIFTFVDKCMTKAFLLSIIEIAYIMNILTPNERQYYKHLLH